MNAYQPQIMGIVNVTPDSFSDGGNFYDPEAAIRHGLSLVADGADILDIGGESTRPGAEQVSLDEELARVIPVIEGLRRETEVIISIDTRHAAVMEAALAAGAGMINDVTALQGERSLAAASVADVPICLMHMQGDPGTMQQNPTYTDVVADIKEFLSERVETALAAGIAKQNLVIDVGIGFGKTLEHNLTLLNNLEQFTNLGVRTLLGASRKSFIGKLCGESATADKRIGGSLAALGAGLEARVDIFRVHDVFETKQYIDTALAIAKI